MVFAVTFAADSAAIDVPAFILVLLFSGCEYRNSINHYFTNHELSINFHWLPSPLFNHYSNCSLKSVCHKIYNITSQYLFNHYCCLTSPLKLMVNIYGPNVESSPLVNHGWLVHHINKEPTRFQSSVPCPLATTNDDLSSNFFAGTVMQPSCRCSQHHLGRSQWQRLTSAAIMG